MGDGITPDMVMSEPGTLDLSKIHYDASSKKWKVLENSFPDHYPSSFE